MLGYSVTKNFENKNMILIFEKNYINSKQPKIIPSNLLFYIIFYTYKSIYNYRRPEVFCKQVFLEILQCSQENTCARVYFLNKVAGIACNFIKKRDSSTGVFL